MAAQARVGDTDIPYLEEWDDNPNPGHGGGDDWNPGGGSTPVTPPPGPGGLQAPVTRGDMMAIGAALGGGWGANIAIASGAAVGAAAIPIGAAAAAGIIAAGLTGMAIGTLIGETEFVRGTLSDWMLALDNAITNEPEIVVPAPNESHWKMEYQSHESQIWWYVPDTEGTTGNGTTMFSNPYDAIDYSGVIPGAKLELYAVFEAPYAMMP